MQCSRNTYQLPYTLLYTEPVTCTGTCCVYTLHPLTCISLAVRKKNTPLNQLLNFPFLFTASIPPSLLLFSFSPRGFHHSTSSSLTFSHVHSHTRTYLHVHHRLQRRLCLCQSQAQCCVHPEQGKEIYPLPPSVRNLSISPSSPLLSLSYPYHYQLNSNTPRPRVYSTCIYGYVVHTACANALLYSRSVGQHGDRAARGSSSRARAAQLPSTSTCPARTSIVLLHPCTAVAAYKTCLPPMRHSPCVESLVVTGFGRYVPMAVYTLFPPLVRSSMGWQRRRVWVCHVCCVRGVAKVVRTSSRASFLVAD